jgi:hypothetical protein
MTKRRTTGVGSSKRLRADVPVPFFQNFSATLPERDERHLVPEFHVFLVGRPAAVLAPSRIRVHSAGDRRLPSAISSTTVSPATGRVYWVVPGLGRLRTNATGERGHNPL